MNPKPVPILLSARDQLRATITKYLSTLGADHPMVVLERPANREHGDFATNAALANVKAINSKPRELATKIVQHIVDKKYDFLERVEIAGPGFINFHLSKKYFGDMLSTIRKEGETYGNSAIGKGKTVIVEFSSPNIAKPFTIGHLRSTIIGDAIARMMSFSGYSVLRDNHLGDWGTQFGKQIVAMKKWGDENAIEHSTQPVRMLVELYVKFHAEAEKDPTLEDEGRAWFAKLEKGDAEARRLWKKCIDWSMAQFNAIYTRLGVSFDMMLGESFFEDKMDEVIADFTQSGIAQESQGALLIFYPGDKYPPLMLRKKDGATLYATRDFATDKYRIGKWGKDILIVNEVGAEQSLYFHQLYEAEEMVGYCKKSQRKHVAHGMIRFKEGKMSTRKGNTIWLEDVLAEAVKRASTFNPKTAEEVGLGALKYNDLKRETIKDVLFDWDEVVNLKGNSGPYLQYTYARAKSVLKKAGSAKGAKAGSVKSAGSVPTQTMEAGKPGALEYMLDQFPEIVARSTEEYAPHHICTYLFALAQEFNTFYNSRKIVGSGEHEAYRLSLTEATAVVLRNGLKLLGIIAPEKM